MDFLGFKKHDLFVKNKKLVFFVRKEENFESHDFDIEDMIENYFDSQWKYIFDDRDLLIKMSSTYLIRKSESFEQFVENYDKKYMTNRCLKYHNPDLCMIYFVKKDTEDLFLDFKNSQNKGNIKNNGKLPKIYHFENNWILFLEAVNKGGEEWGKSAKMCCLGNNCTMLSRIFTILDSKEEQEVANKCCKWAEVYNSNTIKAYLHNKNLWHSRHAIYGACKMGNLNTIKEYSKYTKLNLKHLEIVAKYGYLECVKYFVLVKGIGNPQSIKDICTKYGHNNILGWIAQINI